MKSACFWSIVALLATVLCLQTAESNKGAKVQLFKTNEIGSRPVDAIYCGDQIRPRFDQLCARRNIGKRSTFMDEQEALSFLLYRSPRSASDRPSGGRRPNIVEECCYEGCANEEILEYC